MEVFTVGGERSHAYGMLPPPSLKGDFAVLCYDLDFTSSPLLGGS